MTKIYIEKNVEDVLITNPQEGDALIWDGNKWVASGIAPSSSLASESFVTMSLSSELSNERVLTAGDGIDLTDGGANGNATLAVDVTDIIDTDYGITEDTNNIRINLAATAGLDFSSGALLVGAGDGIDVLTSTIAVDVTDIIDTNYGLTEDSNNIRINLAPDSGLQFNSGALEVGTLTSLNVDEDVVIGGDLTVSGYVFGGGGSNYLDNAYHIFHFDGVPPNTTDFTGNPLSHIGFPPTIDSNNFYFHGKFNKAFVASEAATNLCTNPSFETNTTSWGLYVNTVDGASATLSRVETESYVGEYSAEVDVTTDGDSIGDLQLYYVWAATISEPYSVGFYIKADTAVNNVEARIIKNDTPYTVYATEYIDVTTEWQYCVITVASATATEDVSFRLFFGNLADGVKYYVDGVTLLNSAFVVPYFDGAMPNCSWTGTAHASTSTRSQSALEYALEVPRRYTISFWVQPAMLASEEPSAYNRMIDWVGNADNYISVIHHPINDYIYVTVRANGTQYNWLTGAADLARNTWTMLTFTHDTVAKTASWYRDGILLETKTGMAQTFAVIPDELAIGSTVSQTGHINGWIDDLWIADRVLTIDEIKAIYNSSAPVTTSISPINIELRTEDDLRVLGGVMVGNNATNPTSGQILAVADIRTGGGIVAGSIASDATNGQIYATDWVRADGGFSNDSTDPLGNLRLEGVKLQLSPDTAYTTSTYGISFYNDIDLYRNDQYFLKTNAGLLAARDLRTSGGLAVGSEANNPTDGQIWATDWLRIGGGISNDATDPAGVLRWENAQIQLSPGTAQTTAAYGILFYTDVNLYRGGENILKTDDAIFASGDVRSGGGISVGSVDNDPSTGDVWATADGRFGGGLYVGSIATDPPADEIHADGDIKTAGGISVGSLVNDPTPGQLWMTDWLRVGGGISSDATDPAGILRWTTGDIRIDTGYGLSVGYDLTTSMTSGTILAGTDVRALGDILADSGMAVGSLLYSPTKGQLIVDDWARIHGGISSDATDPDGELRWTTGDIVTDLGISIGSLTNDPGAGEMWAEADARIGGGLYVGSTATDPPGSQIHATGDIRTSGGVSVGSLTNDPDNGQLWVTDWIRVGDGLSSDSTNPAGELRWTTGDIVTSQGISVGSLTNNPDSGDLMITGNFQLRRPDAVGTLQTLEGYNYVPFPNNAVYQKTGTVSDNETGSFNLTDLTSGETYAKIPRGAKAIHCNLQARDDYSGAADETYLFMMGPTATYYYDTYAQIPPRVSLSDTFTDSNSDTVLVEFDVEWPDIYFGHGGTICRTSADGTGDTIVYYQVICSDVSTMDYLLRIFGYFI